MTWFHVEKLTTEIFELFRAKKFADDEKKKRYRRSMKRKKNQEQKREKKTEVKQKEDTQKWRWRKKKNKETWDGEVKKEKKKERKSKRYVKSDERKCWEKKWNKRRDGTKTKKKGFFVWVFCGFSWREKRILKVLSKIVENKTDFFAQKFLNQENRNRKQKRVFPTFQDKNTFLFFGYIKKGEKEKQSWKEESKKRRVIKTRNHFSRHRKRPNMEKKSPREK